MNECIPQSAPIKRTADLTTVWRRLVVDRKVRVN